MVSIALVVLQFLCVAVIMIPWQTPRYNCVGLLITGLGVIMGLWCGVHNKIDNYKIRPESKAGAKLIRTGPYKYVRHPMYTSLSISMFGLACFYSLEVNLWANMALIIVLVLKAMREEYFLKKQFPDYIEYSNRTKRFLPFII
jgi:protein-S-isoprenylcysteine O-methyltransferase Ste14